MIIDYEKLHKDTITKLQEMVNSGKITVEVACGICADFIPENEDERNIKDLINELKCSLRAANCQNDTCGGGHEKRIALLEWSIAWLEKQGEQKLATWSEEDKRILSGLSRLVKDCYLNGGYALPTDEYDEYKKWLKSLRPQKRWKPTKQQLLELRHVISGCSFEVTILIELEEQLKKLL